jgi:hypothetical protein
LIKQDLVALLLPIALLILAALTRVSPNYLSLNLFKYSFLFTAWIFYCYFLTNYWTRRHRRYLASGLLIVGTIGLTVLYSTHLYAVKDRMVLTSGKLKDPSLWTDPFDRTRQRSIPEVIAAYGLDRDSSSVLRMWKYVPQLRRAYEISLALFLSGLALFLVDAREQVRDSKGRRMLLTDFDLQFRALSGGIVRVDAYVEGRFAHRELLLDERYKELALAAVGAGAARVVGRQLFDWLFCGELLALYESSRGEHIQSGLLVNRGLRFRFFLQEAPVMELLPWEALFDHKEKEALGCNPSTPIVRFVRAKVRSDPWAGERPLRILWAATETDGFDRLDVKHESAEVRKALRTLREKKLVEFCELPKLIPGSLKLSDPVSPHHIFHFSGHGTFDGEPWFYLADKNGEAHAVAASEFLRDVLVSHSLSLVFLNSCDSATSSEDDWSAGASQRLALKGIPAVVGMRREIADHKASQFSVKFYELVVRGWSIEVAMNEARRILWGDKGTDWATPVLFLSTNDVTLAEGLI